MKIAIFGIGGVGGIVGGGLAKSHPETYFYVRGENLKAIRENGLRVESVALGDFVARPRLASDSAEEIGVMDAVILSCKGYALQAACAAIAPMVGPETVVLPLLNGVMVSDMMEQLLPACVLADGTIHVFSRLEAPGHIIQTAGLCSINFGMKDGSRPPQFEKLAAILNATGVKTTLSDNILRDSWVKYTQMCGNSTVFCYYDGPAVKVHADPLHERILRAVQGELIAVATAKGVDLPESTMDDYLHQFSIMPPQTMTSLYRDLCHKPADQTELRHVIGRMVELGEQTGVATPYHKAAFDRWIVKK